MEEHSTSACAMKAGGGLHKGDFARGLPNSQACALTHTLLLKCIKIRFGGNSGLSPLYDLWQWLLSIVP